MISQQIVITISFEGTMTAAVYHGIIHNFTSLLEQAEHRAWFQ